LQRLAAKDIQLDQGSTQMFIADPKDQLKIIKTKIILREFLSLIENLCIDYLENAALKIC